MSFIFELFRDMPRQGPGSDASTLRALEAVSLPGSPRVLDVGCGSGAQTLALARHLRGSITAVDIYQPFLDKLQQRANESELQSTVTSACQSMSDLDFPESFFDLIWSEGAIYIIGFKEGLTRWRRSLKKGGYLVASEMTWLRDDPPAEAKDFWEEAYPAMGSISSNLAVAQKAGFSEVHHFVLPDSDWWDGFYNPLMERVSYFRKTRRDDAEAQAELDATEHEIRLFEKYAGYYNYVFYILKKN